MDNLWWRAAWGLCLLQLTLAQIDLNITCRYAGVFHVEKNGRYSISLTEAADLCTAFNTTLPTMEQMKKALSIGFETCRYGFIEGHVVIPRINPNSICAANNTGVYILTSNTSQYDTYCFNASAPEDKEDCTSVTDLPNAFEGRITITIVNRDGTRYTQKGEYRTNLEDIYPSNITEDIMSGGSSTERSTSGGYIFHTLLPTTNPSQGQDSSWSSDNTEDTPTTITSSVHSNDHAATQEQNSWLWSWFDNSQPETQDVTTTATTALSSTSGTTPEPTTERQEVSDWFSWWFQPSHSKNHLHTTKMPGTDSNTMSAGWEINEENEDERDKPPSYSGSGIDDDEDFISSTISTTSRGFHHTRREDWKEWSTDLSHPEIQLQTTTTMTDVDRNGTSAPEENWTQEPQPPLIYPEHHDDEESQHSTSTIQATPSSITEETATKEEQWFWDGWTGEHAQTPKEDSHSTTETAAQSTPSSITEETATKEEQWFWDGWTGEHAQTPKEDSHSTTETADMDSRPSTALQPTADPNSGLVEDLNSTGPLSVTTQQSRSQSFSTEQGGLEEDKDHLTTPVSTSSNRNDGRGGRDENLPEDSATSVEGYTPHFPDTKENATLTPVTSGNTGSSGVMEVTVIGDSNSDVAHSLPEHRHEETDGRSHTTHGSGDSSGSQSVGENTTPNTMRKAQIPEWLIILASLLALALILAVCIAVNSRRRCGQKKKLVINGNGAVEDRKPSGLNGEASKSQEMVHLVNKEPSETPDQFMTADETRNLQNVDMKIGV